MRRLWAESVAKVDPFLRPGPRGAALRQIGQGEAGTIARYVAALPERRTDTAAHPESYFAVGDRAALGDRGARRDWIEYEQATHGVYRVTWGRQARDLRKLYPQSKRPSKPTLVASLSTTDHDRVIRAGPMAVEGLVQAARVARDVGVDHFLQTGLPP